MAGGRGATSNEGSTGSSGGSLTGPEVSQLQAAGTLGHSSAGRMAALNGRQLAAAGAQVPSAAAAGRQCCRWWELAGGLGRSPASLPAASKSNQGRGEAASMGAGGAPSQAMQPCSRSLPSSSPGRSTYLAHRHIWNDQARGAAHALERDAAAAVAHGEAQRLALLGVWRGHEMCTGESTGHSAGTCSSSSTSGGTPAHLRISGQGLQLLPAGHLGGPVGESGGGGQQEASGHSA